MLCVCIIIYEFGSPTQYTHTTCFNDCVSNTILFLWTHRTHLDGNVLRLAWVTGFLVHVGVFWTAAGADAPAAHLSVPPLRARHAAETVLRAAPSPVDPDVSGKQRRQGSFFFRHGAERTRSTEAHTARCGQSRACLGRWGDELAQLQTKAPHTTR
jgi:hypothetical protein